MSSLASKLESILFAASRPVKLKELTEVLKKDKEKIAAALAEIKTELKSTGINLIEKDEKYQLVTNPENSKIVSDFLSAEVREKLTDASIETLAIVLYKQPISRAEIEAIRGVNSQYILRQLSIRGLVEKKPHHDDARRLVYTTTLDFMSSLGIRDMKELPNFDELTRAVTLPEQDPIQQQSQKESAGEHLVTETEISNS